jgi:aldose 1-epimerase
MKSHFLPAVCLSSSLLLLTPAKVAGAEAAGVEKAPFGRTRDGQPVELYTLTNGQGMTARVITYGAIIAGMEVPDKSGQVVNVTANCENLADYEQRSPCFGAVVGRYANRIGGARFELEGKEYSLPRNNGKNHIHGGRGFDKRVWQAQPVRGDGYVGVELSYVSADGEEGYPGKLTCTVRYELTVRNEWKMIYTASTDKPTVVNLSNHAYWNLAGAQSGTVLDHLLSVNSDFYLEADEGLIPTGKLLPVVGTPLDFREPHAVGDRMGQVKEKQFNGGYDHCMVIRRKAQGELVSCARLKDPKSGRVMEVLTTEPGVQIFSANFGGGAFRGPGGYVYPRNLGLCLETQHYPDSPNKASFPSTVLRPGETFRSTTIHRFTAE